VRSERQTGPEVDDGTARLLLCGEVPADPDWFEGFETERVAPETVTERDAECVVAGDDWEPTVAGSAPVVVFLPSDTPAALARDAGARRVVRRDDPEARALLVRAVESVVGRRDRSGSVESAAGDDAVDPPADVLLETVLDHAADSVSVVDSDGEIVYSSTGVERQLGDDPETLRGESFFEAVHPEDRTAVQETFRQALDRPSDGSVRATYRRRDEDDSWRWIDVYGRPWRDDTVDGLVVSRRDVTRQERRRRELRERNAYLESVLDAQPDVFYVLDPDGTFRRWNAPFADLLGYDDETLRETHATEVIVARDREKILSAMTDVYHRRETRRVETRFLTADGEEVPYQVNGAPLTDGDGNVTGLVGTGRDISDRVRREERLSVLNRVLRHNIRNQSSVLLARADHLRERVASDDETHVAAVSEVAHRLSRMGKLARKVDRALAETDDPDAVPLPAIVDDALEAFDPPEEATVEIGDPPAVAVRAAPPSGDALAELLDNAVRHNPDAAPTVAVEFSVHEESVTVAVDDDGPGIPDAETAALAGAESQLDHSAGLGMWFVNWVVEATDGHLSFADADLGGSRVLVEFRRESG